MRRIHYGPHLSALPREIPDAEVLGCLRIDPPLGQVWMTMVDALEPKAERLVWLFPLAYVFPRPLRASRRLLWSGLLVLRSH